MLGNGYIIDDFEGRRPRDQGGGGDGTPWMREEEEMKKKRGSKGKEGEARGIGFEGHERREKRNGEGVFGRVREPMSRAGCVTTCLFLFFSSSFFFFWLFGSGSTPIGPFLRFSAFFHPFGTFFPNYSIPAKVNKIKLKPKNNIYFEHKLGGKVL